MEPSLLWRRLRKSKTGAASIRGIMHQLIASVANLHERGIVHRDVKTSNILLNSDDREPKILIADFSSGVSDASLSQGLYGAVGPTTDEETLTYAPPEVLLRASSAYAYDPKYPKSFDVVSRI